MLSIALVYTTEDQSAAHRIVGDLDTHVSFEHLSVGRANEGPVLANLVANYEGSLLVLISDNFLTNPNCMLRGHEFLGGTREVLPVYVKSHGWDELEDEPTTHEASLNNQAEVMYYVNHWQDRYIELRRQQQALAKEGGENFERYFRKIRETSVQAEELLHRLKDSWSITEAQFAASHYQQLFIFADRPRLWEEYKQFEETPADVSEIPGISMLTAEERSGISTQSQTEQVGDGAPVQSEVEEQSPPLPPDPPAEDPAETEETTDQATVWIERAWALYDADDAPAGLELLNSGRDALPDQLDLHFHYALLLATATEDAPAARKEVEALLDKSPDHPDALFLNGELHEAADNHVAARENWEHLSDVEPFYPDLNLRLGSLLVDHFPEDKMDAAAYLRRASKDEPANAEACYRYALLLAGEPLERKKKAVKQLRRALEADPQHDRAHYQLAVLLHEKGKYGAARNAYLTAARLQPAYATPANEAAFAVQPQPEVVVPAPSPEPTQSEVMAATAAEEAALAALKKNISELETVIADREAALETSSAPASAPKIGDGKTVLISGATAGIGRATARRLAEDGYRLILLGRRAERLRELRTELFTTYGTETHLLEADVRDRPHLNNLIGELPEEWADIDILINNAGKAKGFDAIHTGNHEHWDEMIDVNVKGLLYLTRAVSPGMVARGKGTIINVASTAGKEVYPNGNVYCASKHAVDALTYSMRLDLVEHGIRVGQICPAMVEETEFAVVRFDGDTERAKIYQDFQPLRSPDVADAIAFMINQPRHVNVMDLVLQGTQQATSTVVDRSGREKFALEEE